MSTFFKKIILTLLITLTTISFVAPATVLAAGSGDFASDPNAQLAPTDCGNKGQRECGWNDFISLINRLIKFVIYFSATLSVMAFCYAGFLYLTAFGEMGKIEEAHSIFRTTIVGMLIVMMGWLIVATILKTLGVSGEFTILDSGNVQTIQGK